MKDKKNSGKDTLFNLRPTEKEVMQNIHLPVSVDELMKKLLQIMIWAMWSIMPLSKKAGGKSTLR